MWPIRRFTLPHLDVVPTEGQNRFQKYVCFLLMRRQSEDRDAPSLEASLQAVGRRV